MKNIIYLFLVATVFLCSCKGSSFLSQRYTHFGHGAKRSTQAHAIAAKQYVPKQIAPVPAAASSLQQEPAEPASDLVLAPVKEQGAKRQLASSRLFKKTAALIEAPVKEADAKTGFQQKKQSADAVASHRGLLSGLVGLILYIVLCAIVIAAIIILVTILI